MAANLADEILQTDAIDNEELEDRLRALAKKQKLRAEWDSTVDMLVMRAGDSESCRWLIDAVYELRDHDFSKAGGSSKRHPKPGAHKPKTSRSRKGAR